MPSIAVSPNPIEPSQIINVDGAGFDARRRLQAALNGLGWTSNEFRSRKDGTFRIGIPSGTAEGDFQVAVRDLVTKAILATANIRVQGAVIEPPPPPPPDVLVPIQLQAAIDATPSGGTLNLTGRIAFETVTFRRPITVIGGTIDAERVRSTWADVQAPDVFLDGMQFLNAKATGVVQTGSLNISQPRFRWRNGKATGGSYASVRPWVGATDALIEGCDISGAAMGIVAYEAHRLRILGGRIHDCTGTADTAWESGAVKIGQSTGVLVQGVEADRIQGPGIWLDVYCSGGQILRCKAHDNTRCGLMVEIQDGYLVDGNTVYRNAVGSPGNAFQMNGGIFISSSRQGRVTNNVAAWNGFGTTGPAAGDITFVSQARDPRPHDGNSATGNVVRSAVKAIVAYTDSGVDTRVVTTPNTLVADTDPRIAGLR